MPDDHQVTTGILLADDFLGDAANYAISLLVVGMALRYRASAAMAKGATMAAFGLWVVGTVIWHALHGTLPSAFTMGTVGVAALVANAVSFGLLLAYRHGDANMRSAWICTRNDVLGNLAVLLGRSRRVRHPHRMARCHCRRDYGSACAARCGYRDPPILGRVASQARHRYPWSDLMTTVTRLRSQLTGRQDALLGSAGIHREFITAAARWIMEAKL
jgi:hypothetical protein